MKRFLAALFSLLLSQSVWSMQEVYAPHATALELPVLFISNGAATTGGDRLDDGTVVCQCSTQDIDGPIGSYANCATSTTTEVDTDNRFYLPLTEGETAGHYSLVFCTSDTTDAMDFDMRLRHFPEGGRVGLAETATHTPNRIFLETTENLLVKDEDFVGQTVQVSSGNCKGYVGVITDSDVASDFIDVSPAIPAVVCTPDADLDGKGIVIFPQGNANVAIALVDDKLGAFDGGANTVFTWLQASMRNDVALPTLIGGSYNDATHSQQAIAGLAPHGTAMRGTDSAALAANVPDVLSLANIEQRSVDAQVQHRLNELIVLALASQPTVGSLLGDLTEDDGGTQRFTTNALEQAPSGGGSAPFIEGTSQSFAHTTLELQLASGQIVNDNDFKNYTLEIVTGDCKQQGIRIESSVASTNVVTVAEAFLENGTCAIDADFDTQTYRLHPPSGPGQTLVAANAVACQVTGTVDAGPPRSSTQIIDAVIAGVTNGFIDRWINFTSGATVNGLSSRITGFTTGGTFTFKALRGGVTPDTGAEFCITGG